MIILPKRTSYDLPEGSYRAFLRDAFETVQTDKKTGRAGKVLRLVFQITSLKHPRYTYLAGKNYNQSDATKLANDLESWLGDELNKLVDKNGAISIEKIEALKGREADIDVVHIDNDRETTFKHIQRILPPGKLVDDDRQLDAAA